MPFYYTQEHASSTSASCLQTAEITDEIIAICEQANIQLMDGTMWSHNDRAERMQEAIAARLDPAGMGPLKAVTCTFCFAGETNLPAQHNNLVVPQSPNQPCGM